MKERFCDQGTAAAENSQESWPRSDGTSHRWGRFVTCLWGSRLQTCSTLLSGAGGTSMAKVPKHLRDLFEEDEEGECPPLKPAMIRAAEKTLGYRLPAA